MDKFKELLKEYENSTNNKYKLTLTKLNKPFEETIEIKIEEPIVERLLVKSIDFEKNIQYMNEEVKKVLMNDIRYRLMVCAKKLEGEYSLDELKNKLNEVFPTFIYIIDTINKEVRLSTGNYSMEYLILKIIN
jgi:hypothetical protein